MPKFRAPRDGQCTRHVWYTNRKVRAGERHPHDDMRSRYNDNGSAESLGLRLWRGTFERKTWSGTIPAPSRHQISTGIPVAHVRATSARPGARAAVDGLAWSCRKGWSVRTLTRHPGHPLPELTDVRGGAVRSQPAVVVEGDGGGALTSNTAVGGAHTVALCARKSKKRPNIGYSHLRSHLRSQLGVTVNTGVPEVFT